MHLPGESVDGLDVRVSGRDAHVAEDEDVDVPAPEAALEDVEVEFAGRSHLFVVHAFFGQSDVVVREEDGFGGFGDAGEDDVAG